ncbi:efflux RND transporter permease subunit [Thalassobaculum salexigens]|uniref:efflux RND transporter permease subunit n=1 Tax=Thalassobaculum salexigens TaxID=455360 RepID=UPI0004037364|nr:efflux RND transporter permease subunit [Thalassobaculum salexigens]
MKALISAALSRSRTTLSALLLILIAGTVSYIEIPKEADPDINIPIIYVSMTYEGISPEDAERLLLRPMEQELRAIEGIKEMRSTAYEGGANVTLEFDAGFDADQALDDVREKVDIAKPDLPEDADEPTVNEVNFSLFPVLVVTLSGNVEERVLLRTAQELRDAVESIPSVLEANLAGEREELVEVVIDPVRLETYGLQAADVLDMVARSNNLIAAGSLDTGTGRFPIKVPGLYEDVLDILDQPLKSNGDAVVRIRDIGTVQRSFKDRETYARLNGQPAIALEVSKRAGENVIETIEYVRAVVNEAKSQLPDGITVTFSQDKSDNIRLMLSDLQNNVMSAILLVMIVIVGAMGIRTAGLVGMAIPGSFLLGILVLSSLGLTINIVVLFSLILAVGMMVDGAIVVTEFADRKMAEGVGKRDAYRQAGQRMAWPIIASTATTLAAFFPLLFWPGVVGEFMKFLPITLLATLSASLLMALIFVPALGAQIGKASASNESDRRQLAAAETGDLNDLKGFTGLYLRVLNGALRMPGAVLLLSIATLIGVQYYYATHGNGIEFFPEVEPDLAQVYVHARGNLSVEEKLDLVLPVERVVMDVGGFKSLYTYVGSAKQGGGEEVADDVIGSIQMEFADWQQRPPASQILAEISERTKDMAGIIVEPREEESGPPTGKPVQLQLRSRDREALNEAADTTLAKFRSMDGLKDLEDTRDVPGIEWEITVDRTKAARYAADVSLAGQYVQLVTKGLKITDYRPNDSDEEIDIVVRYPEAYRTLQQIDRIRIETAKGLVPITNFMERTAEPKVGKIRRVDTREAITVRADVRDGILPNNKVMELREWLDGAPLPANVEATFKGEDEEQQAAQAFLVKAFGVALFIMAIILVTQFNSFYSAFLILSAVIMSTIGVILGLMITGSPFGIVMTGIGVIALAGIVVNNNIVLIDTFDTIRPNCVDTRDAILRTGAQRLRPVMLTTITTILGLIPMVMQVNIDFISRAVTVGAPSTQWWVALATAIVYGLAFATVLTLVVTPCALMFRDTAAAGWRGFKDRVGGLFNRGRGSKSEDAGGGSGGPEPQAAE